VEHHEYENPFEEVHRKVRALKDRNREVTKRDAEDREILSAREAKEIIDKESG
jgi:hypothetical protein